MIHLWKSLDACSQMFGFAGGLKELTLLKSGLHVLRMKATMKGGLNADTAKRRRRDGNDRRKRQKHLAFVRHSSATRAGRMGLKQSKSKGRMGLNQSIRKLFAR